MRVKLCILVPHSNAVGSSSMLATIYDSGGMFVFGLTFPNGLLGWQEQNFYVDFSWRGGKFLFSCFFIDFFPSDPLFLSAFFRFWYNLVIPCHFI